MAGKLGYSRIFVFVFMITLLLRSSYLSGAESSTDSGPARYRVFSLRHISAQRGKAYLAEAGLGTVSQLPGTNTLLVTAQPSELIKASAILKLVDDKKQFVIKAIFPASAAKDLPSNDQIASELGNISIGTFSNPPADTKQAKAIIDIHNDSLIAVAPAAYFEKIIWAIEQLQKAKTETKAPLPAEPEKAEYPEFEETTEAELESPERITPSSELTSRADTADSESDELFSRLLGSLAEAEKTAAESRQVGIEPNEPNTFPIADFRMPIESRKLEEVAEKPKLELKPGPEQSVVEPTPPREEVVEPVSRDPALREPSKVRSYEPEPIANGEEILELNLPERLTIVDLLGLVGEYLHLDYMYDPVKVTGEVTLKLQGKLRGPIKLKDLYPLLESVLKFKGFVMTRKGNLITIVPAAEVLDIDPVLLDAKKGEIKYGDVIVTRIFKLKHINTTSAKNLLDGMKLGTNIRPIGETKTLIITGYAYRMARIEELLEMVDKPGEPKKFRFRQLKYTMAKTLAPKIKTLAEQLGTISITIAAPAAPAPARPARGRPPARPAPPPAALAKPTVYLDADERTNRILMIGLEEQLVVVNELIDALDVEQQDLRTLRLYDIQHVGAEEVVNKLQEFGIIGGQAAAGRATRATRITADSKAGRPPTRTGATKEALVEEPQVVVIEATNSLLVNATAEQHARIAVIIGYVDSETEEASIPYVVYPLENQDPEDLAAVLTKLIQETTEKTDKAGKIERTTIKKIEEKITIIPDKNTFSLIVYASKKNQQWIESLIKQLDKRRPQVLIDVTLVQITKDDIFQFDLDLLSSIPDMAYTSGIVAVEGMGNTIFEKLLLAPDRSKFIDMKSKAGSFTGFYGSEKINALLTAMQTKKYGRVMARPKLLVNDNETGTIKTTDTTYITRTDTSWIGVENPQLTETTVFEDYTAGITLEITPHISIGDMLRLEITLNRSAFDLTTRRVTADGQEVPPDKVDADVATVVTVPDKSTIILGGMEKIEHGKGGTKVPFLGDLPFIGGLFRSISKTDIHDKLYIFVKAHILRPGGETALADLKEVSRKNRETFERLESEMHRYEDWPGIKPKPMDPEKILEAD